MNICFPIQMLAIFHKILIFTLIDTCYCCSMLSIDINVYGCDKDRTNTRGCMSWHFTVMIDDLEGVC